MGVNAGVFAAHQTHPGEVVREVLRGDAAQLMQNPATKSALVVVDVLHMKAAVAHMPVVAGNEVHGGGHPQRVLEAFIGRVAVGTDHSIGVFDHRRDRRNDLRRRDAFEHLIRGEGLVARPAESNGNSLLATAATATAVSTAAPAGRTRHRAQNLPGGPKVALVEFQQPRDLLRLGIDGVGEKPMAPAERLVEAHHERAGARANRDAAAHAIDIGREQLRDTQPRQRHAACRIRGLTAVLVQPALQPVPSAIAHEPLAFTKRAHRCAVRLDRSKARRLAPGARQRLPQPSPLRRFQALNRGRQFFDIIGLNQGLRSRKMDRHHTIQPLMRTVPLWCRASAITTYYFTG